MYIGTYVHVIWQYKWFWSQLDLFHELPFSAYHIKKLIIRQRLCEFWSTFKYEIGDFGSCCGIIIAKMLSVSRVTYLSNKDNNLTLFYIYKENVKESTPRLKFMVKVTLIQQCFLFNMRIRHPLSK